MAVGIPPININSLGYVGEPLAVVPCFEASRAPLTSDVNYPIETIWRNTTNFDQWILVGFANGQAQWRLLSAGAGQVVQFPVPNGNSPVMADGTGNVTLTSSGGTITITGGVNAINFDLTGGGVAVDQFSVQAATAPGVTNVTPTAAGLVTVNGAAVAAHSVPVETRSRALNAYNVEVQYGAAVAATDATKSGLAHFNSSQFSVDANGFVALAGGGLAIDQINVDANTAPGTDPVLPDGSGQITVTGAQVAAGTVGANVIRTDSLAANTYTIEIQRSTAVASTASVNNGVSHFDSADFTVDANGFVTLNGTGIFLWQTTSVNIANMGVNRGYICISPGGALTLGLPSASALGDMLEITLDGATSFQITQAAGQQIRIANATTTLGAGGSLTTTAQGDTLRLVCQTANLKWNVVSFIGNFTVV